MTVQLGVLCLLVVCVFLLWAIAQRLMDLVRLVGAIYTVQCVTFGEERGMSTDDVKKFGEQGLKWSDL